MENKYTYTIETKAEMNMRRILLKAGCFLKEVGTECGNTRGSNNQIRGYSRPIIYWGVYDIPVLTIWAHSLSFLISCSRMFAYNNNFLSPSLWYTRLFIVSIIKG